ncbi:MAG: hypothetical protein NDJ89_13870 [Oligoflexia bacterium]|nr:hypothetical protein [Oligoflexia bacterium]
MRYVSCATVIRLSVLALGLGFASSCALKINDPSLLEAVGITLDPPAAEYINLSNQSAFDLGGTCSAEGGAVKLSIGGAPGSTVTCTGGRWSATLDFSGVPDGPVVLTALHDNGQGGGPAGRAMARSAAKSAEKSLTLQKDASRPSATPGGTTPASPASSRTPRIVGSASADTALIELSLDASCETVLSSGTLTEFQGSGLPITVPLSQASVIYAQATDSAGNSGSCEVVGTYVNDYAAPVVAISSPASDGAYVNLATQSAVSISGTCSKEGVDISVAAGAVQATASCAGGAFTASLNLSTLSDGAVSVTATQNDGTSSGSATRALIKDTTLPTLAFTATNPASPAASGTPLVIGTASSDAQSVSLYLDSACASAVATGTAADFQGGGIQFAAPGGIASNVKGTATDAAGNVSACTALGAYTNTGALGGTYSVKADGTGNFVGIAEAVTELTSKGQASPVVFEVYAGSYAAAITLNAVAGNSTTNGITIRKAAAAGGSVTTGGFTVNGPDAVTLAGFDSVGGTIRYTNAATDGLVADLTLNPAANTHGIFLDGQGNHGFTARQLRVNVSGAAHGIQVALENDNVTIERSELVGSNASAGIYVSTGDSDVAGITGLLLRNNVIRGTFYRGLHLVAWRQGVSGAAHHNSIRMERDNSVGVNLGTMLSGMSLDFRNNVIAQLAGAGNGTVMYVDSVALASDSNILYAGNGNKLGYWAGTGEVATLADWQAATGQDVYSYAVDPLFVSAEDLQLQAASLAQNRGSAAVGLATDFNGMPRDGAAPDPGAFENAVAPSYTAMGGGSSYRVKPDGSGEFLSIASALEALHGRGQSGPVVIDVYAGTYGLPLGLSSVAGNGATSTITLQKAADAGGAVVISKNFTNYGNDYLTLKGFDTVNGTIAFVNGANYGTIRDMTVNGSVRFSGSSVYGLVEGLTITPASGANGVILDGAGNHNLIARSLLISASGGGRPIYLRHQNNNVTIERSILVGAGGGDGVLVDMYGATGGLGGLLIRNNFIYGDFERGVFLRAYDGSIGATLHQNTIVMSRANSYAGYFVPFWGSVSANLKNNIFVQTAPAGAMGIYCSNSGTVALTSNHNLFYLPNGATLGFYWVTTATTLAQWQTATGGDANSLVADPLLVGPTDLHLQAGSPAQGAGQPGLGVAQDIDGEARPDPADIGADEL